MQIALAEVEPPKKNKKNKKKTVLQTKTVYLSFNIVSKALFKYLLDTPQDTADSIKGQLSESRVSVSESRVYVFIFQLVSDYINTLFTYQMYYNCITQSCTELIVYELLYSKLPYILETDLKHADFTNII